MDLANYLKYAGSVARTGTLLQAGFSERTVRNAVSAGEIVRIRHGVVALAGAALAPFGFAQGRGNNVGTHGRDFPVVKDPSVVTVCSGAIFRMM